MTFPNGSSPTRAYVQLRAALYELAVYPGRIQERLHAACAEGLREVRESDLPTVDLRSEWRSIASRVSGPAAASACGAGLDRLSEGDACIVAEDLFRLAAGLRNWLADAAPETWGSQADDATTVGLLPL